MRFETTNQKNRKMTLSYLSAVLTLPVVVVFRRVIVVLEAGTERDLSEIGHGKLTKFLHPKGSSHRTK